MGGLKMRKAPTVCNICSFSADKLEFVKINILKCECIMSQPEYENTITRCNQVPHVAQLLHDILWNLDALLVSIHIVTIHHFAHGQSRNLLVSFRICVGNKKVTLLCLNQMLSDACYRVQIWF